MLAMEIVNPRTGVRQFCEIKGQDGPGLALIHGWSANHRRFERLHDLLSQQFRTVSYDHRGHGLSEKKRDLDYSLGALVLDLLGVLDELGLERPVLMGHSMGGIVALEFARAFPERVRGLVLLGTAARVAHNDKERASMLRAAWMCRHAFSFVSLIKDKSKRAHPDIFTDIADPRFAPQPAAVGMLLMGMAHLDIRDQLSHISAPALAVGTPGDATMPFDLTQEMAGLLPDCRLTQIPDATHHFITENPGQTFDAVAGFISQLM